MTGIYAIEIGNRIYIGSAADIEGRWRTHLWAMKSNRHHSIKVQRAYNKYEDPQFSVVEVCNENVLLEREQYWLDELNCVAAGLNIQAQAGRSFAGMTQSSESNQKRSEKLKGRTFSEETRNKMSVANKGRAPAPMSEDARAAMSTRLKGNKHLLGHKHSQEVKDRIAESVRRTKAAKKAAKLTNSEQDQSL